MLLQLPLSVEKTTPLKRVKWSVIGCISQKANYRLRLIG